MECFLNVISGLFMGMTVDVYSLYYACRYHSWSGDRSGISENINRKMVDICGSAGNYITVNHCKFLHYGILIWQDYIIRFYGSGAASAKTPMGMVGACFVVQFFTDYIDRVICLFVVSALTKALPRNMMERL